MKWVLIISAGPREADPETRPSLPPSLSPAQKALGRLLTVERGPQPATSLAAAPHCGAALSALMGAARGSARERT